MATVRMREFEIQGYLVGDIWMPTVESYKELSYKFVRDEGDKNSPWTDVRDDLRDAVLHVTNDGDFQSCKLADGVLIARVTDWSDNRCIVRERAFPIEQFPSVADMVRTDWDGPTMEDE